MNKILTLLIFAFLLALSARDISANGRIEAAPSLTEPTGARAASLGEAFASVADDITAFGYNPASLRSLKTGQASFLFQRGLSSDSYGHFMIGHPGSKYGMGLSVGYYNSGTFDVYDGVAKRSVTGQRDLTLGVGLARDVGPVSLGVAAKYLSSELADQIHANAAMLDLGLQMPLHKQLRLGAAVQNLGGQLRYVSQSDDLPKMARLGVAWAIRPEAAATTLLVEGVYHMTDRNYRPAVGFETLVGPLAFRAGYTSNSDLAEFTFGTGFSWGSSSLDYAFGLVQDLSASHRVSLSTRFGSGSPAQSPIVQKQPEQIPPQFTFQPGLVYEIKPAEGENPSAHVYFVRQGDTLKSIARAIYGREEMWNEIYRANQHLMENPEDLKPGQRILLPGKSQ